MTLLIVSKTISIELEDLGKINEKIKNGEVSSLSEFVKTAVKKHLEER